MIVNTRYNFETNSSSMHSLVLRNEGTYSMDEILHSNMNNISDVDCFIVTNQEGYYEGEELGLQYRIYDSKDGPAKFRFSYSAFDTYQSPMMVLNTFLDKYCYLVAAIWQSMNHDMYEKNMKRNKRTLDKMRALLQKQLPKKCTITFDFERQRWHWDYYQACVNSVSEDKADVLHFLEEKKIGYEEFLLSKKYIIIVNYKEYQNMKFLNMVDENAVVEEWVAVKPAEETIKLNDGVWQIQEGSLTFGRSPFRVLGTPADKARYVLAAYGPKCKEEILEALQTVIPELKDIKPPRELKHWNGEEMEDDWGYCEDNVVPRNIAIKDFILDKKYVIISDGDEYCVLQKFAVAGLMNLKDYHLDDSTIEDIQNWK